MTRPGRMVRELMRPDPPGSAAERIRHRRAAEQAYGEMLARYSPLTPEVMPAALAWQEARIRDLVAEASPPRCASCPHDHHPHAVCSRRSGGTAYRCGCVCGSPATRAW